jgi:hypothetical protein
LMDGYSPSWEYVTWPIPLEGGMSAWWPFPWCRLMDMSSMWKIPGTNHVEHRNPGNSAEPPHGSQIYRWSIRTELTNIEILSLPTFARRFLRATLTRAFQQRAIHLEPWLKSEQIPHTEERLNQSWRRIWSLSFWVRLSVQTQKVCS